MHTSTRDAKHHSLLAHGPLILLAHGPLEVLRSNTLKLQICIDIMLILMGNKHLGHGCYCSCERSGIIYDIHYILYCKTQYFFLCNV